MENSSTYKEGDLVRFNLGPVTGEGKIRGLATTALPSIGAIWIVEVVKSMNLDRKLYPFSCLVAPESLLTLLK